jgi:hypothetical protein
MERLKMLQENNSDLRIIFIGNIMSAPEIVYSVIIEDEKEKKIIRLIEKKPRKISKKVRSSSERVLITYKCKLTGDKKTTDIPLNIAEQIMDIYNNKVFEILTEKKGGITERFKSSLKERTVKVPTLEDFCWHVCIVGRLMQTRYIVTLMDN